MKEGNPLRTAIPAKKRDARVKRAKMMVKVGILSRATFVATKESPQKMTVAIKALYVFSFSCSDMDRPLSNMKKNRANITLMFICICISFNRRNFSYIPAIIQRIKESLLQTVVQDK